MKKKRILSVLLTLCMALGTLPMTAFADDAPAENMVTTEGASSLDENKEEQQETTQPTEPAQSAEPAQSTEPTAIELLQNRINALPGENALEDMDEDEQAEVYEEICDIYDAIDALTGDEADSLNVSALEEAATFFTQQVALLAATKSIEYVAENADKRTLSGSGTEEDPYLINSVEDLDKIRYYVVNTSEVNTADTVKNQVIDGYFKLTRDIDCSSVVAWIPIGRTEENKDIRYKTAFVGTFDGGGYTISKLTLDTSYRGVGIFTRVGKYGTVKNLTIDTCTTGTPCTMGEVGAVCGTAYGATFSNITLKNITIYVGGYAGALSGDIWTIDEVGTTVTNCSVQNSTISGGAATGGMFGRTHEKDTLTGCNVSNTEVTASDHSVAGLAGILGGPCENCHATNVTVNSTMSGTAYAGGLFGQGSSTLIDCSASGTVSAGENGQQAGGLGAYYYGTKLENCSANVNVEAKNHVGGLIGYISATTEVKNCHAKGNVTITAATKDNHTAGGLIGRINNETITNCYATGNVIDQNTPISSGGIGGLIGVAENSTITGSYAKGNVTGAYTTGGLIGYSSSTITNCYATGTVTGTSGVGGLVGRASGQITNSYSTGAVTGNTSVGGFVGFINAGTTINGAAASGNVTATSGTAGGFVGHSNGAPNIENALATGTVTGTTAGAFIGSAATVLKGLKNCYANSTSAIPFTGTFSGYYSPQNCFYGGSVTGMLASGLPNGSSWQNYDYYYAKMLDFITPTPITGDYGDPLSLNQNDTVGSKLTGVTPKHTLTVKASPETLVSVNGDGTLKANAVGEGTISLVMTVNGKDFTFGTANVDVSPKDVSVSMSNSTVDYDGNSKTIDVNETELPSDLNLVYSYKVSTAADSTYTNIPPTAPGTYTVKVESGNSNYTLSGTKTATLTISAPAKDDVSEAVVVTEPSLTYNNQPQAYSASHDDITDWTYTYYDANSTKLSGAPVNAGSYTVTIAGNGTGSYAVKEISFVVAKADPALTLSATSGSCRINRGPVTFTYEYEGEINPNITVSSSDTNVATASIDGSTVTVELKSVGTAIITVSAAEGANYKAATATYALTVQKKKSSSSSSDSGSSSVKPAEKPEEKPAEPDVKPEEKPATPTNPAEIPAAEKIVLTVGQRVVNAFGSPVVNDVAPIIREDRTMLPIRFVAEALGAAVTWDGTLQKVTITKGDDVIDIYIGSVVAFVNGSPVELDSPAFIENSRTYLPLRFVAENLGATVFWNAETQEVTIVPNK